MREGCFVVYRERAISPSFEAQLLAWVESMDDYRGGVESRGSSAGLRVQKWYQEHGHYFDSSWKRRFARWEACPYSDRVRAFQWRTQMLVNRLCHEHGLPPPRQRFNSLLLNKYRDGRDCIRAHSDSSAAFGDAPLIAVVSLGETRAFKYTSKTDPSDSATVELAAGSILLMAGQMQQHYTHEIVRDPSKARARYSLTWRHFLERPECSVAER